MQEECAKKRDEINSLINEITKLFPEPRADDIQICGVPACDKLSYEFENFLVAFPRLNGEPLMTNLSRTMSKVNAEQLKSNCFKKNDVNGLFWEINLLRNRFAHSTPGYYAVNIEYAQRYMALSSKIYNIRIIKEKIVFNTTLIIFTKILLLNK